MERVAPKLDCHVTRNTISLPRSLSPRTCARVLSRACHPLAHVYSVLPDMRQSRSPPDRSGPPMSERRAWGWSPLSSRARAGGALLNSVPRVAERQHVSTPRRASFRSSSCSHGVVHNSLTQITLCHLCPLGGSCAPNCPALRDVMASCLLYVCRMLSPDLALTRMHSQLPPLLSAAPSDSPRPPCVHPSPTRPF